ncbi:MAG: alpha-hydroxy acid oxidase [Parvularculaceae bacterium]
MAASETRARRVARGKTCGPLDIALRRHAQYADHVCADRARDALSSRRRGRAILAAASSWSAAALLPSSAMHGLPPLRAGSPDAVIWQQIYLCADRDFMSARLHVMREAGVSAVVVTADLVPGGFSAHAGVPAPPRAEWEPDAPPAPAPMFAAAGIEDLEWFCSEAGLPVLVKGVLRADDARRCLDAGARGLVVSNHGGNQLSDALATCDALPAIVAACGDNAAIIVDGGIRSGACAFKALALGAHAVMIGRPTSWGLAANGADGAAAALALLDAELDRAMRLCGASDLAAITRGFIAV